METDDLLNRAKSGDTEALIAWSQSYKPMISRLAYQAGIPIEEIGKFNHEVVKDISNKLESVDGSNAENKVLESAVHILETEKYESGCTPEEGSLKFEEDLETHQALQKLPMSQKLAVILSQFHGKSLNEIDELLMQFDSIDATIIEEAMDRIRKDLSIDPGSGVQKRLDLLSKSYNRISFPEEDDVLMEEMQAVDEMSAIPEQDKKPPMKRRTIAILAGASLFLAAVIGTSFLFNDQPTPQQTAAELENPTTISRQMVKNWEAEYEAIRKSAPGRLGLSDETFEQLEYVRKADALKERTFSRQNVKQLKDDPERMQEQVDVLMLNIETPKGMLDSVEDYSLLTSEVSKFLWIYTEKTDQLMTIADGLLEQYQDELANAEVNGELSVEKLRYSRAEYPEEIEKLTKALSEYTFNYTVHPNENRFRTIRDVNKFYEIHPFNSEPLSTYYLEILQKAPFTDETGHLWPVEDLLHSLWTMTAFLGEPTVDPGLKEKVEFLLIQTFHSMVKGDGHTEVFDSNGVVKEEVRIAWEGMLQLNSNPITFIMLPIVEEFEASGWKESDHFNQFAFQEFIHAIEMERNGELAEKLPNGDLKIESAIVDMEDYDYSDIKPLYEEFSSSYDLSLLSGIAPMEIIKLYHYANRIEDIETMWHLTADDELKPSLEEYTKRWKKRPEITETLRNIEIYENNFHRQGREVLLIAMVSPLEDDKYNLNMHEIILITERDEIWLMQHQMNEFYARDNNFEEFDANVQSHYKNLVQSGDLKTVQQASPAEIGGIFLLAMEKEDLKTVRLLVNLTDKSIDDEEFELRWMSMQMPAYSKFGGISFWAYPYNLGVDGISLRGSLNIMNDAEMMESSHYLEMEKVAESWMIGDRFGY